MLVMQSDLVDFNRLDRKVPIEVLYFLQNVGDILEMLVLSAHEYLMLEVVESLAFHQLVFHAIYQCKANVKDSVVSPQEEHVQ